MISGNERNESGQRLSKESTKLKNELDKLSGLIIGKNALQSPLSFGSGTMHGGMQRRGWRKRYGKWGINKNA